MPACLLMGLGVLCIIYGILVLMIASGTLFFVVWFVLGGGCMLLSLLVQKGFFRLLPKPVLVILGVVGLAVLLSLGICEILIIRSFHGDPPDNLPYLIVLGAQVRENGPSKVLRYRLDAAAEYMEAFPETVCIVTGGRGFNEPVTEGSAMKKYLVEKGVDASRILTEEKAVNTNQNIHYSMAFLPSPDIPVGIVTNDFHLARACALAKKQGLVNACGISAPSDPLYLVNNMLREYFGMMKDFIAGNI